MSPDSLARWQFASTTIYHFMIVPVSIGLALLVATMQTLAYRRHGTESGGTWDRSSRFWGKLMLISFAIGVVTGIVQEFQFGMNWSSYSRFVGDIFGAPLAMEGLIAFFLESTFLGLWIFGRDILSPKVHLATIWLAAGGSAISAYFILAANSWMQHPVGYRINPTTGVAEMTNVWKVLTNSTQLVSFPHVLLAAMLTGGAMLLSVSAWHLRRPGGEADPLHRKVLAMSLGVVIVAAVGASFVGHIQGQIMTTQQPMKMAAAEALWNTKSHAAFSLFAYGDVSKGRNKIDVTVPDGLSVLATDHPGGTVQGINQIQAAESAKYGAGNYVPVVGLAYWCFRLMIGFGALAGLIGLVLLVQWRRGRLFDNRRLLGVACWTAVLPLLANTAGWLFTETGRQPWLVYGLLKTQAGVSPNVSNTVVAFTLFGFVALYGILGVIAARLLIRTARQGPDAPGTVYGLSDQGGGAGQTDPDTLCPSSHEPPGHLDERVNVVLPGFWFGLLAVLWAGFFVLEGFDFGVGLLLPVVGRTELDRQVALRAIGPTWDGNEVWLLVAGGATFAAFPAWYASMFAGLYIPLALVLAGLIVRGIGLEYRSKVATAEGRAWCDRGIVVGSLLPALLFGVAFADLIRGFKMDAGHQIVGGFFDLVTPFGLLGGLVTLGFCAYHGAVFLGLRTEGEVRERALRVARRTSAPFVVVAVTFLAWSFTVRGGTVSLIVSLAVAAALLTSVAAGLTGHEAWSFVASAVVALGLPVFVFASLWPDVVPARNNPAWSLTVHNASANHYALVVMTVVAVLFTPIVIAYQAWAYWVFRARVTDHTVDPKALLPRPKVSATSAYRVAGGPTATTPPRP